MFIRRWIGDHIKRKEPIVFNWHLLAVVDLHGTNFYKFYGRFEEIGVLQVGTLFTCFQYFGLDILLGIDVNLYLIFNMNYNSFEPKLVRPWFLWDFTFINCLVLRFCQKTWNGEIFLKNHLNFLWQKGCLLQILCPTILLQNF